ncbi:glycosyl hydrolase family 8 [Synechococcus sp. PCC 7336]|uniref:glycosyl hydrolase family 8 n=1 Tax=Synechococcus sp. PCC 7336 TaxID=195250 RepID=UPI0003670CDD|nr:glycosyl hydrolase family 8 [Synechococcus sp. PCC 7336]
MDRTTSPSRMHLRRLSAMAIAVCTILVLALWGCVTAPSPSATSTPQPPVAIESPVAPPVDVSAPPPSDSPLPDLTNAQLVARSWTAYRARFIQADGRVIDWEANARTVSEGQAYGLLLAVWNDDPDTFDLVLGWAERHLQRTTERLAADADRYPSPDSQTEPVEPPPADRLWAWKWEQRSDGSWGIVDTNFATDADVDAVTALILAARRWHRPDYEQLALAKLDDIWNLGTIAVTDSDRRYLLPGPEAPFRNPNGILILNPSYVAPYAFRLFDLVDGDRDWGKLVEGSYRLLTEASSLSAVNLPGNWVGFSDRTERYVPLSTAGSLSSRYGFDAIRVWWRLVLDARWFGEPRAVAYLNTHLTHLQHLWRSQQAIPAEIDLSGIALADFESTAQYGMLYAAFALVDPDIAADIRQQKLLPQYRDGIWENNSAYYTQNLVAFGLLASEPPPASLAR